MSEPSSIAPPHPPPHPAALSARQAAATLGVNEKTVRRWIERGRLAATKDDSGAYRIAVAELARHRADTAAASPHQAADSAAGQAADMTAPTMPRAAVPAAPPAAGIDLAPLVDHIAALEDRVQQLVEAATIWQVRAMQAEDRLKQLTAGGVAPQDATEATPRPPITVSAAPVASPAPWWRFWERR